jgi:hypothetical protein
MRIIRCICIGAFALCGTAFADNHAQPTTYGQSYNLIVTDPAAAVAAMTKYRQSATGQKMPTQVILSQNLANGAYQATHTVNVFYPSAAAMDMQAQLTANSPDTAEFFATMRGISTVETDNVFTMERSIVKEGTITSEQPVQMLFGLEVTDQAAFTAAFDKLWNSSASAAFPGNMFFGRVIAMGESASTHWVSFLANDMASLIEGVDAVQSSDAFAAYAKNAPSFRNVEGRFLSRQILNLTPPEM